MREAIREVDRAIDKVRGQQGAAKSRRLQAGHQQQLAQKQVATLDEQARFAMSKRRPDLAEAAVARQLDLEEQVKRLTAIQAETSEEEARLNESLATLKAKRSQMLDELAALQSAQAAAGLAADGPGGIDVGTERKVARAEETFERAMAAAGGVSSVRTNPEAAAKVAEIDALQKEAAIAERLAALRGAAQPGGPPSGKGTASAKKMPARKKARA
jgi:phage shock protein A